MDVGKLLPLEHPEILYLPPNLPDSTPKKTNLIPSQAREETPDLEDMNHQELVDLVKELLQESANRPPPTNTSKDIPLAGHVTMNQESFVQSSQAILQGLAGGWVGIFIPNPQSLNVSLEMIKRTSWILICGKDKSFLQPQVILV